MSALLLAVYENYETADRVRSDLVQDGFPTDRVDVTARCDPGRASVEPADSLHGKFVQYFRSLFPREDERDYAELLAGRVENGATAVTVLPRGAIETARATEILERAGPLEIMPHDLSDQTFEHAASQSESPWIRHFLGHSASKADCIYCRLFESGTD